MMFMGRPGLHVIDTKTSACIGVFDSKGYLEIEGAGMIEKMKKTFSVVGPKKKKSKDVR